MSKYIVYYGRFELPDKNALAHRVRANAMAFVREGYRVILVGYTHNKAEKGEMRSVAPSVESYSIEYPSKKIGWLADRSYLVIKKIIQEKGSRNIKAVFFTGIGFANMKGILNICQKAGIPCVYDVVDWFPYNPRTSLFNRIKYAEDKRIRKHLLKRIKNFIFISSYLQENYVNTPCNSTVIPSLTFADDPRFASLPQYSPTDGVTLCYAGSPGVRGAKDRIDWCVRSFAAHARECDTLCVFGVTKEGYISDFPEDADIARRDNIMFMGKQTNQACIHATAEADYFIFAREDKQLTRAGFPTKFSESLAVGTPVITTPTSDLPKYLIDGENGFLAKDCSCTETEKAVEKALRTSAEHRQAMHDAVKRSAKLDCYSWRGEISAFLETI